MTADDSAVDPGHSFAHPSAAPWVPVHEETRLPDPIDFRPLKEGAKRLLRPGDPLREALLREPDTLPREIGLAKLDTYVEWMLSRWP